MTSHDCVAKIRHMIGKQKVGHTGTLDPEVEGVLPICIGEATKIIPFLSSLKKEYIATVFLGTATTTEDAEGKIVDQREIDIPPTEDEIDHVLQSFTGEITQIPPMYSAVKVKGRKLYEYARDNIPVERPIRQVTIHELLQLKKREDENSTNTFSIRISCSKGTYIRTLCVDIGKALGYPAHMGDLKRIETDAVKLKDTISFEEIKRAIHEQKMNQIVIPIKEMLNHIPTWQVDERLKIKILHGQKLPFPENLGTQSNIFKAMYQQQVLAIYERRVSDDNKMKPIRVFNTHKEKVD